MGKTINNDHIEFDATTQGEGFGPNKDGISVVFKTKFYVRRFKVDTGDGGDVLIRSRSAAGAGDHARYDVLKGDNTPANDTLDWPYHGFVDGLYIVTLPANAKIIALIGYED